MLADVRALAYSENRSYTTYKSSIEDSPPEAAANTLICLIHQTNYLLDLLLRQLEQQFLKEGGFTEKLYRGNAEPSPRTSAVTAIAIRDVAGVRIGAI